MLYFSDLKVTQVYVNLGGTSQYSLNYISQFSLFHLNWVLCTTFDLAQKLLVISLLYKLLLG